MYFRKMIFGLVVFMMFSGSASASLFTDLTGDFGNVQTINIGAEITGLTLGQNSSVILNGTGYPNVTAGLVVQPEFYDVAFAWEITTLDALTAITVSSVNGGSNPWTEVVVAILGVGNVLTSDLIDIIPAAGSSSMSTSYASGDTFRVALFGNLTDDAKTAIDGGATVQASYELNVSAVPVPAAVCLFGTAVFGLPGFRKKANLALPQLNFRKRLP